MVLSTISLNRTDKKHHKHAIMEKKLARIIGSIHLANHEEGDNKTVDERPVHGGRTTRASPLVCASTDRAGHGMACYSPSDPKSAGFESSVSNCLRQMPSHSPPECSDSSSSLSSSSSSSCTFEEFSISCTSESSVSAKGEWSPASVTSTQCRPLKLISPPRVRTSLRSHFEATPVEKWDTTDIDGVHLKSRPHTPVTSSRSTRDGFLEFSFHDGRLVENQLCPHAPDAPSNCTSSTLMVSEQVTALEKVETTSFGLSDEEGADGSNCNPAFFSASARSFESCSEKSDHSGDASSLPSVHIELNCAPSMSESSYDSGQLHSAQVTGSSNAQPPTPGTEKHSTRHIEDPEYEMLPLEVPSKAEHGVDRAFSEAEPQSRTCALNFTPNAHRHEEGFSFQRAPVWRPPKSKGRTMSCSPVFSKVGVVSKARNIDHQSLADMVLMQSKGLHRKGGWERQHFGSLLFDRHFSSVHPHDNKEKATETVNKMVSVSCASENVPKLTKSIPLSSSSTKYSEKADEFTQAFPPPQARGKMYDEFSGAQVIDSVQHGAKIPNIPNSPASCTAPMDWRSKSLGARASLRSAVRNLEAALGGSRSVSVPKTRSNNSQKYAKAESLRLLDRVFVSPMKSRLKPADVSRGKPPNPAVHLLQACDVLNSEMHGRKGVKLPPSSAIARGQMKLVNLPPWPAVNFKHNVLDLEISCKPALPASRTVHCAASQLRAPDLLSSRLSAASPTMQQGCLQAVLRSGAPCYTLTLDGYEDIFVARSCAMENHSSKEGCKWMYTFESVDSKMRGKGTGSWKNWIRKDHKSSSELTGKMQVSTVLLPEVSAAGGTTHSVVSEFVLYDGRAEDTVRSQSLRFWSSDMPCPIPTSSSSEGSPLSTLHASAGFFSPPSSSTSSDKKFLTSPSSLGEGSDTTDPHSVSPVKGNIGHRPSFSLDMRRENDLACSDVEPVSACPSHMELAAMVIKLHANEHDRMPKMGDDCSIRNSAILQMPYQKSKSARPSSTEVDNQAIPTICHGTRPSSECVTLLLPKGDHSLPNEGQCGPSSLIQRWRSGGKCECGGWDMGCGLKVFSTDRKGNHTRDPHTPSPLSFSQDMPLSIFSQGSRPEVILTLSAVQEGLFVLSFHSQLTLLRAFSTAVAILHSKYSLSAATETCVRMGSPKERPPHPPQMHYSSH